MDGCVFCEVGVGVGVGGGWVELEVKETNRFGGEYVAGRLLLFARRGGAQVEHRQTENLARPCRCAKHGRGFFSLVYDDCTLAFPDLQHWWIGQYLCSGYRSGLHIYTYTKTDTRGRGEKIRRGCCAESHGSDDTFFFLLV